MPAFKLTFFKYQYLCGLLCFLFAGNFAVLGQPKQIIFKHYGVAEGFNSNEAMDISQTKEGLIWISSADGLIRFDSKNFKYFRHNNSDSQSIANNYCKAMQVDKRGKIWIVADDELDVFDPATERFSHIKNIGKSVNPKAFYYDALRDRMWIATANGLYFSKNGSQKLEPVSKISKDSLLANGEILSITAEGRDWLWITSLSMIVKLHATSGITEKYPVPLMVNGRKNNGYVYPLSSYLDKQNTLWLGTLNLGLFSFNTVTHQFAYYTYRDEKKEDNTIFSITQTHLPGQEDVLFFGATGFGFGAFNTHTKKFTSYNSGTYNTALGIKGNAYSLRCFNNKLWISSSTGLHCYDYSSQLFEKKDLSSIANGATLAPTNLMSVERTKNGIDEKLWLHIPYKNAYIYDLVKDLVLPVPAALKKYMLPGIGIFTMFIDSKNILWLGTNQYGMVGYDINKKIILTEQEYFYKSREWAHHFFEDSKNNLWICTYNGLYKMDSGRKNVMPVNAVNDLIKSNKTATSIAGITEDEFGKIWLTADYTDKKKAAIIKLDVAKNSAAIIYNEQAETGPHHNPVDLREICSNKKGKIFLIFRTEHIAWFNSNAVGKIELKQLDNRQGLNNTNMDQLLTDSSGNIWCNNQLGISQYKVNQNSFSNYSFANYELNTTHNPSIYISPNSGNFYIGQSNSFLLFKDNSSGNNIKTTNLLFNDFKIYNSIYPKKIKDGDKINLTYKQDMISIEFALL
ncbi:MAG: hypothetical protein EOP53_05540, partial [Sphingobacteriales bacterium]